MHDKLIKVILKGWNVVISMSETRPHIEAVRFNEYLIHEPRLSMCVYATCIGDIYTWHVVHCEGKITIYNARELSTNLITKGEFKIYNPTRKEFLYGNEN